MMDVIGDIFILLLLQPMLNALIFLYAVLFQNIAYSIIALTVVTRLIFYPLTVKQLKASATMQRLGPEMAAIKTDLSDLRLSLLYELQIVVAAIVGPMGNDASEFAGRLLPNAPRGKECQ